MFAATDAEAEESEGQMCTRYKPEGLDQLIRDTKFNRKELQLIYRGFKQENPTGLVNKATFKEIYQRYFPQGDTCKYATYVFDTLDVNKNGCINFEEFVLVLSVLSRGSINEKLEWAFNLYDINQDGHITRDEMLDIVRAIYDMMGKHCSPPSSDQVVREHAEKVFQMMDSKNEGRITREQFFTSCMENIDAIRAASCFDTAVS